MAALEPRRAVGRHDATMNAALACAKPLRCKQPRLVLLALVVASGDQRAGRQQLAAMPPTIMMSCGRRH